MKKIMNYLSVCVVLLLIGACAKDSLWNQNGEVPADKKGTIVGQLLHDENSQPLKGVKILFERQTTAKGGQTFVDTVSTDAEGKFAYQIPFPNKVKVSIRDTGRYAAVENFVEVLEHREYNITLLSYPRFGVMPIKVHVNDTDSDGPFADIHVSLWVREAEDESYSMVESILTDAEGNVQFDDIAWPVNYKVQIEEDKERYKEDIVSGRITDRDPLGLTLNSFRLFGQTTLTTTVTDADAVPFTNVKVALYLRQNEQEGYVKETVLTTDVQGKVVFENIDFPVQYRIVLEEKPLAYDYEAIEDVLNKQRQAVNEVLIAKSNFGVANVKLKGLWYFHNQIAADEKLVISYKSLIDNEFSVPEDISLSGIGEYTLSNFIYPAELKIESSHQSIYPFRSIEFDITEAVVSSEVELHLKDSSPRFLNPTMTNLVVSTLDLSPFAATGPQAITGDNDGNIYIADGTKNQLFKRDIKGNVTVIAGTGSSGNVDGPGTSATFNGMWGVAVDSSGILYTVDAANVTGAHRVRKIQKNAGGTYTVSTLAGTGSAGGNNGAAATATFNRPAGILYDKFRHCLYVAEWAGARVRKIDLATSTVSTVVGTGSNGYTAGVGTAAQVNYPHALSLTSEGRYLYISNYNASGVSRVDLENNNTQVLIATSMSQPRGLFVTNNNKLMVTRGASHQLAWIDNILTSNNSSYVGLNSTSSGYVDGNVSAARFNFPFGIYYDKWTGNWYIADSSNGAATGKVRLMRSSDI